MDDNPLNNVFLRNAKPLTYVALEIFHNTSLHFIETLKVRAMARNLKTGDVSMYFANKVEKKRKYHHLKTAALISGVVSGFFGAGLGALTFMTSYEYLTQQIYAKQRVSFLKEADWRIKNTVIFTLSDIVATFARLPFETRK